MTWHDDGSGPQVYIGGDLHQAGQIQSYISRWNGSSFTNGGAGITGTAGVTTVHTLLSCDHGAGPILYAGGRHMQFHGMPFQSVAQLSGGRCIPVTNGLSGTVWSLTLFDDGNGPALYAAGNDILGTSAIARLDSIGWIPMDLGITGTIFDSETWSDGLSTHLFIAGDLTSPAGDHFERYGGNVTVYSSELRRGIFARCCALISA